MTSPSEDPETPAPGSDAGEDDAGAVDLGEARVAEPSPVEPAPEVIRELAEACVRFVERATGVRLDYTSDTLSVLDHYLAQSREAVRQRPETLPLIAQTAGAYFGEVVRRLFPSFWDLEAAAPSGYRLAMTRVHLVITPTALMREAVLAGEPLDDDPLAELADLSGIELAAEDVDAVGERLNQLPQVTDEELAAPTTRLEVIEIAVDAIHARRVKDGDPLETLGPEDYAD